MPTTPIRVPETTHREVQSAAHLLGCTPAELLQRAWDTYRETAEFKDDFELAQKAFSVGDLNIIASRLEERAQQRARSRAARVQALREDRQG